MKQLLSRKSSRGIFIVLVVLVVIWVFFSEIRNRDRVVVRRKLVVTNKPSVTKPGVEFEIPSDELTRLIDENNRAGYIRNRDFINSDLKRAKWGSNSSFLVVLVQVHSRVSYLKELVESLKSVKGIDRALVVFSHDYYDEEINRLVRSIDFCATLQIFYPLSMQVFKNRFPGSDPCDCARDLTKSEALIINCCNAGYHDSFGHHREADFVQIKHHWTWKISFVFEAYPETKSITNLNVLLLEEDYILLPDALHVFDKLKQKVESDIDIVSLGIWTLAVPLLQKTNPENVDKYSKAVWHSYAHNTGFIISRPQWNMLKDCFHSYCTYDDYNWDWSIQHVSHGCFKDPLVAIHPDFSRVFHIGSCGIHHQVNNCDPKEKISSILAGYSDKKEQFFPSDLTLNTVQTKIRRVVDPNGGWSDPRDHQLCKQFLLSLNSDFNQTQVLYI